MAGLGAQEIIVIVVILVVVFGLRRLPQIGKDLGTAIKEMRKAGKELTKGDDDAET